MTNSSLTVTIKLHSVPYILDAAKEKIFVPANDIVFFHYMEMNICMYAS